MTRDAKAAVFRDQMRNCEGLKSYAAKPGTANWANFGVVENKDGLCVSVRMRAVKRNGALESEIAERIKTELNPARIDVQHTGPVLALPLKETAVGAKKCRAEKKARRGAEAGDDVLTIGSSISLAGARTGTLGFFARCRKTGQIGIVSANHVIGGQDRAQRGDAILSPGGSDFGMRVASFERYVPLSGGGEKYVDCAFARLETTAWDPSIIADDKRLQPKPATAFDRMRVWKYSEESGVTEGIVTLADQDTFKMHYRSGVGLVMFDNQIEVESAVEDKPFATTGDSGALVYDEQVRPVGLLFAQTLVGGTFDNGLWYVSPISVVLDLLEVDLV
jgi:hypothetical protein